MAVSSKVNWTTLVVFSVGAFLIYKSWPAVKRAIAGIGGASGGGVGAGSASTPYIPTQGNTAGSAPQFSGSAGLGGGAGAGSSPIGSISNAIANLLSAGTYEGSTLGQQTYIDQLLGNDAGDLNSQGIPLVPANQDLNNLPSYSYDDPNAPWNSQTQAEDLSVISDGTDYASYVSSPVGGGYADVGDGGGGGQGPTDESGQDGE